MKNSYTESLFIAFLLTDIVSMKSGIIKEVEVEESFVIYEELL